MEHHFAPIFMFIQKTVFVVTSKGEVFLFREMNFQMEGSVGALLNKMPDNENIKNANSKT